MNSNLALIVIVQSLVWSWRKHSPSPSLELKIKDFRGLCDGGGRLRFYYFCVSYAANDMASDSI